MQPMRIKPTISAGEQPQTYALERAANGTGYLCIIAPPNYVLCNGLY
jgi:hypothetical protein